MGWRASSRHQDQGGGRKRRKDHGPRTYSGLRILVAVEILGRLHVCASPRTDPRILEQLNRWYKLILSPLCAEDRGDRIRSSALDLA
jgi:hypothetical protein